MRKGERSLGKEDAKKARLSVDGDSLEENEGGSARSGQAFIRCVSLCKPLMLAPVV